MESFERLYNRILITRLINEDVNNIPAVPDERIYNANIVPKKYLKFFVSGSGHMGEIQNGWSIDFTLKIPTNQLTDGVEDRDTFIDYTENQISAELPHDNDEHDNSKVSSYALITDEDSNESITTIRCFCRGLKSL